LKHTKFFCLAATTAALTISQSTMAAGFAVSAQSAYGMGNAYAGNAAVARDVSTVITNPAGIFELEHPTFGIGVSLTATASKFTDKGTRTFALIGAEPVDAPRGANEGISGNNPSPGVYYARVLNDKWALGFGVNVPFASSSEYDDDWIGRYHAVETSVTAIDLSPSIAYKVNDKFSIAGGLIIQSASALLTNKLDSGTTCVLVTAQAGAPVNTCGDSGLQVNDQSRDSNVEVDGSGTELSFNIGALFKPREGTRIGIAYRHGTQHSLEGSTDFTVDPVLGGILAAGGSTFLSDTGSAVAADLPATLDLSVAQMVRSNVELLGTVKFTQWSSFDELTTTFDNPEQDASSLALDWEDTVTISTGFNYSVNEKLTLRAGFSYDQSPVPNPRARTARGPANDRYWYSAGGTYSFTKKLSVSFAAVHIQIDQSAIDNTGSTGSPTLRGTFDIDANLLAAQLNWHFI